MVAGQEGRDAQYMDAQQKNPKKTGRLRLSSKPKKSMACNAVKGS